MAKSVIHQVANKSDSNYCKLPDGTLIQHGGVGSYTGANRVTYTVTFPVSFVNTNYHMVANGDYYSDSDSYEVMCTIHKDSASQAKIHVRNPVANYANTVSWIAVGRWK